MLSRKLPLVALTSLSFLLVSCSATQSSGGDNGLACRNYVRVKIKNAGTVLDWTKQLATDDDVMSAFAALAEASSDNALFVTGNALTVFSSAATAWKAARVAVEAGSDFSAAVISAAGADDEVGNFCSSIGEAFP